ncbi:MAG: asparagine synthetase B [Acidobacteria bacterium]|nr:MAG: asparagine synthetase B [Acidobacteriota bacterium]
MSGFICILHWDNAPIDRALLESLTDFLSFRGPDACEVCLDGSIGMGHALLRTTHESKNERQPASLEERYRIVADARLDAREELIDELQRTGRNVCPDMPDGDLLLHAYAAWGASCVDHLLGDFSFALWDARCKQLFCARDHFGVKPFYYASIGALVVLSNTLNCIRHHPAVSAQLNDLAIADFLLFDTIRESGATSFRDIQRLPPAHILACEQGRISVRRYWTLPVSDPIHHKRPGECLDEFRELMDRAVADRMRMDSVAVLMSGGLDSPTVAAIAKRALNGNKTPAGLRAYTEVFERLIPHEERRYAELVVGALKIPIEFQVSDEIGLWKDADQHGNGWPEPIHSPFSDGGLSQLRQVAAGNCVALTGFGGDPALSCQLSVHFSLLLKNRQIRRALSDVVRYFAAEGRFSRLYLRTRWQIWFGDKSQTPQYPVWLNQDLEKPLGLRERWETFMRSPARPGASRATAQEAVADPFWPNLFEGYDPGVTSIPVEVRHPFFDLRLVTFLLALPALPWCSDKELLREAARGVLPDAVRLRRKSPLPADPLIALLERPESKWVDSFEAVPELGRYVERKRIPKVFGEKDAWTAWIHLRPLSLNFWLRSRAAAG